jgi:hypothetical protein
MCNAFRKSRLHLTGLNAEFLNLDLLALATIVGDKETSIIRNLIIDK